MSHARFSPSASSRWLNCTASIPFCEEHGLESTSSPEAEEGTVAHLVMEKMAKGEVIRKVVEEWGDKYDIEEMVFYIYPLFNWIRECGLKILGVEQKAYLDDDIYGTTDIVAEDATGCLYIIDLKYGKGVEVAVEDNPQLKLYAAMVYLTTVGRRYKSICTVIYQPRISLEVKEHRYLPTDLFEFLADVLTKVERIKNKQDIEFNSGKWCQFCPARSVCPELNNQALALLNEKPTQFLTLEQLTYVYGKKKEIVSFLEAVESRLKDLLLQGIEVPGYHLTEGRRSREWCESEEAIIQTLQNAMVSIDIFEKKLKTPAKIEKELKDAKIPLDILDGLFAYRSGNPTIASSSSKRVGERLKSATELLQG